MTYDAKAADRVKQFISLLKHSTDRFAGKPFSLLNWQEQLIDKLFGTMNEEGQRQYTKCFCWTAKKSGKSSLLAAICLYCLIADNVANPVIYILARNIKEAGNIFDACRQFIRSNPTLHKTLHIQHHIKEITFTDGRPGLIKVLAGGKKEGAPAGTNWSVLATDEIGWYGTTQQEILADLTKGDAVRSNSLWISISTASFDRSSYGFEHWKETEQAINNPDLFPRTLATIYTIPEHLEPLDEKNWHLACPSIGETVPYAKYREWAQEAKANPRKLTEFLTLSCCRWVGTSTLWIPYHIFNQCKETFEESRFHGQECFIGLDSAIRNDLFAYCLLIRENDLVYVLPRCFLPRENIYQKSHADHVPYEQWERQGYLTLTEGDIVDQNVITERLLEDQKNFRIRELRFDPNAGALNLMQALKDNHGFFTVNQSTRMQALSAATYLFEQMCYKKQLRINSTPVFDWCLGNCIIRRERDHIGIDKPKATSKIDLITASIIGLAGIIANPISDSLPFWL